MQISTSERFLAEYNNFKNKIESLNDEQTKLECRNLLAQLVGEVKKLDNQHSDMINIRRLPDDSKDTRNKILEIRKKLSKRLEEIR